MASRSGVSRAIAWTRRLVPAVLGAGILYLTWRIVTANDAPVKVDFLVGRIEIAVWEALLGSFVSGAGLVGVYALYQKAKAGLVGRKYRRKLAALEAEVHQLRNLPLFPDFDPQAGRSPSPRALFPDSDPQAGRSPSPRALFPDSDPQAGRSPSPRALAGPRAPSGSPVPGGGRGTES